MKREYVKEKKNRGDRENNESANEKFKEWLSKCEKEKERKNEREIESTREQCKGSAGEKQDDMRNRENEIEKSILTPTLALDTAVAH